MRWRICQLSSDSGTAGWRMSVSFDAAGAIRFAPTA